MRETIKEILIEWAETMDRPEDHGDAFFLERFLGAVQFLKSVSYKVNDIELLGITSKMERYLQDKIEEEDFNSADDAYAEFVKNVEIESIVKIALTQAFYKDTLFSIDMSKYKTQIEEHRSRISDLTEVGKLLRYCDEKQVLSKIYTAVKWALVAKITNEGSNRSPEGAEIRAEFESQSNKIRRRADKHIAERLHALGHP